MAVPPPCHHLGSYPNNNSHLITPLAGNTRGRPRMLWALTFRLSGSLLHSFPMTGWLTVGQIFTDFKEFWALDFHELAYLGIQPPL